MRNKTRTPVSFWLRIGALIVLICIGCVFISLNIGGNSHHLILAFTSKRSGSNQIYLFDEATAQLHLLPNQLNTAYQPAWSPKDTLAVVDSSPLQVSVVEDNLSRITQLASKRYWNDYQPDWSQAGQLALATDQNSNWDIMIYSAAQHLKFAPFNTASNELEPCWWSDGKLSFVSDREGNSDIYVYDFGSRITTNLTNDPANDYNPACSPDNQLAFTSTRDYNAEVYVMNLKTGQTRNVSNNVASDFNPAWLPDGRLSFVSDRDGNREIYVLDMLSNQLTNVTQNPADDDQPNWTS